MDPLPSEPWIFWIFSFILLDEVGWPASITKAQAVLKRRVANCAKALSRSLQSPTLARPVTINVRRRGADLKSQNYLAMSGQIVDATIVRRRERTIETKRRRRSKRTPYPMIGRRAGRTRAEG